MSVEFVYTDQYTCACQDHTWGDLLPGGDSAHAPCLRSGCFSEWVALTGNIMEALFAVSSRSDPHATAELRECHQRRLYTFRQSGPQSRQSGLAVPA